MPTFNKDFSNEIDEVLQNYDEGGIEVSDGIKFSQKQMVKTIAHYSQSKYLGSDKDPQGRRKPFYNVVNAVVDIETRATDLDVKDIQIKAEKDYARAMMLRAELRNWLKDNKFSLILNQMNESRIRYGTVVVKKTETRDTLEIDIVPWEHFVTDQMDLENGHKIERHFMSPTELRAKQGAWENVDAAIDMAMKNKDKNEKRATQKLIEVLEIEGEFPKSYFDEGEDDQFAMFQAFVAVTKQEKLLLFHNEITESRYKFAHRRELIGRALGQGAVEDGIEAQIGTNEAVIGEKIAMELAGKNVIKTTSSRVGANALTEIEDGQIIEIDESDIFEPVQLAPSGLPEYQRQMDNWFLQYQRVSSTHEAVSGETLPSGTTLGGQAIQAANASSIHDYRREQFGFLVRDIVTDWVLPFVIRRIKKAHTLQADFTPTELRNIRSSFANFRLSKAQIAKTLDGELFLEGEQEALLEEFKTDREKMGNQERLEIPDNYFKDVMRDVTVYITDEQFDKESQAQTLLTLLQMTPPEDQESAQMIREKLIELSGTISPASFPKNTAKPPQQAPQAAKEAEGSTQNLVDTVTPDAQK